MATKPVEDFSEQDKIDFREAIGAGVPATIDSVLALLADDPSESRAALNLVNSFHVADYGAKADGVNTTRLKAFSTLIATEL